MPKQIKVTCSICKKDFYKSQRDYNRTLKNKNGLVSCSKECRFRVYSLISNKKSKLNCSYCSKEIYRTQSEIKNSKTDRFFCSHSCSANYNGTKTKKICTNCSNFRKGASKYCNKCNPKNNPSIIGELTIKELEDRYEKSKRIIGWVNSKIREFCRGWNKELIGKPCVKCGYDKHTEFCHIKAISSFSKDTKIKTINSLENIAILCRNCHWELDNNLWEVGMVDNLRNAQSREQLSATN